LTAKDDENLFEACITENFIEIGKQQFTGAESYQEIKQYLVSTNDNFMRMMDVGTKILSKSEGIMEHFYDMIVQAIVDDKVEESQTKDLIEEFRVIMLPLQIR
jgi:hypothetical protein